MRLLYKTGPMESLRKWFYKPKRDDRSLLAQFFYADDALNMVAAELDSFDGKKDPERCSTLVNQLRHAQDRVLNITSQIMDEVLGDERVARGFRVKFPEDVLQENLAGQLWFGAECLAAGSSIMNREEESASMRPLAKALTRSLETVRSLLREQCMRPRALALSQHDDMLQESLRIFDRLFAEFELCYVSAMVNVKTPHEFEAQQLICVLFSETLCKALKRNLLTQEQVDSYDPALMFAVPRLAIVSGLLVYANGPLSIDKKPEEMSEMFRPFRTLLHKIRSLLWTLDRRELNALERLLVTNESCANLAKVIANEPPVNDSSCPYPDIEEFESKFFADHGRHALDLYNQRSGNEATNSSRNSDDIEIMISAISQPRSNDHELNPDSDVSTRRCSRPDAASDGIFQNDPERTRTAAREEYRRISALRDISSYAMGMFDPSMVNEAVSVTINNNRRRPDHSLVMSLEEQVAEITQRLSWMTSSDNNEGMRPTHSLSANNLPAYIESYVVTRNDQLNSIPSTSHGYLIPNAISQEPAVLASLSHNNSAVFNQDDPNHDINVDIPTTTNENVDAEVASANISIANANLSSLLLTNEELTRNNAENAENVPVGDDDSFHSAKNTPDDADDRVKFMLGYDSENEPDSGNASLDRSPDNDPIKKDITVNRDSDSTPEPIPAVSGRPKRPPPKTVHIRQSFRSASTIAAESQEVPVRVSLVGVNDFHKSSGPPSASIVDSVISMLDPNEENINVTIKNAIEATRVLQAWGAHVTQAEVRAIDSILYEMKDKKIAEMKAKGIICEENNNADVGPSQSNRETARNKNRKNVKKNKKKTWAPNIVIVENRPAQSSQTTSALRLNLEQLVDDSDAPCIDDEQIAVALQAQELAARKQMREKFRSSEDLIHRLFVCIAGVADQLQTNFASDLRNILKAAFQMNQTPDPPKIEEEKPPSTTIEYEATDDQVIQNGDSFDSVYSAEEVYADGTVHTETDETALPTRRNSLSSSDPSTVAVDHATSRRKSSLDAAVNLQGSVSTGDLTFREESTGMVIERPPEWVPDIAAAACMRCSAHFTAFRRRHHCRNCGKVFCASCSSNSIPLPRYGQMKPVRVCEECFRSVAKSCYRRPHTSHQ